MPHLTPHIPLGEQYPGLFSPYVQERLQIQAESRGMNVPRNLERFYSLLHEQSLGRVLLRQGDNTDPAPVIELSAEATHNAIVNVDPTFIHGSGGRVLRIQRVLFF